MVLPLDMGNSPCNACRTAPTLRRVGDTGPTTHTRRVEKTSRLPCIDGNFGVQSDVIRHDRSKDT